MDEYLSFFLHTFRLMVIYVVVGVIGEGKGRFSVAIDSVILLSIVEICECYMLMTM